jgi:hypothetical protein
MERKCSLVLPSSKCDNHHIWIIDCNWNNLIVVAELPETA